MKTQETKPQVIDAVDRALAILECFSAQRPKLGITEISRELDLHKSTVFRCLASLEARNLVTKDSRTQRYSLGPKVLRLAAVYESSVDVREKAAPTMEKLRARTKETISLWVPAGDRCVCIDKIESALEMRWVINVGDNLPMHASSPGVVLQAFMPEADLAELASSSPHRPLSQWKAADRERFEAQLALVRERRFAVSVGEDVSDGSSASAPVFNARGEVIAALAMFGPTSRFSGDVASGHAILIRQAAEEVSMQMGYGMYLGGGSTIDEREGSRD